MDLLDLFDPQPKTETKAPIPETKEPIDETVEREVAWKIRSKLFGEEFWIVYDDELAVEFSDRPQVVYTLEEFSCLHRFGADRLRFLHEVKKITDGTIEGIQ